MAEVANTPPGPGTVCGELEVLVPTMDTIIRECPGFRVLVAGRTGAGKSSLINRIFKVDLANVSEYRPGQATIDHEFTSEHNPRFVAHDSMGYAPGDVKYLDIVKRFVKKRSQKSAADRLHVIWLCIPIPTHGARTLERGDEELLKLFSLEKYSIPVIVVFTVLDSLVSVIKTRESVDTDHSTTLAKEQVKEMYKQQENMHPFVCVSSAPGFEYTLIELTKVTLEEMNNRDGLSIESPRSPSIFRRSWSSRSRRRETVAGSEDLSHAQVLFAIAQGVDPGIKIEQSIAVGGKKYWRNLMSNTFFSGHSLKACLKVIQSDVVHIWNLGYIQQFLLSEEFVDEVSKAVEGINDGTNVNEHGVINEITVGMPAVGAIIAALAPVHPGAPVTIPVATSLLLGIWLHAMYQKTPPIIKFLMASIVALVLIMESLFHHLPRPEALLSDPMLTPDVARQVVRSYRQSQVRKEVHDEIEAFVSSGDILAVGKGVVLGEVQALIAKYRKGGKAYKDWNEHQVAEDERLSHDFR